MTICEYYNEYPDPPDNDDNEDLSFQKFLDDKQINYFKGVPGLNNINKICEELGYRENLYHKYGQPILQYLSEESELQNIVVEFIRDKWNSYPIGE